MSEGEREKDFEKSRKKCLTNASGCGKIVNVPPRMARSEERRVGKECRL